MMFTNCYLVIIEIALLMLSNLYKSCLSYGTDEMNKLEIELGYGHLLSHTFLELMFVC